MLDLLLDSGGDLKISDNGEITLTQSAAQAIKIRLKWFFNEWKFYPPFGVPYYEEILIKNPSKLQTEQLVREQILSVDEVQDVSELEVELNSYTRTMKVNFAALVNGEILRKEMMFDV